MIRFFGKKNGKVEESLIITVTLNPALDYIIETDSFQAGSLNRYEKGVCAPGGKGINVSILLHSLGVDTIAAGICGGYTGKEILRQLQEKGCYTDFVTLSRGDSRINFKITDRAGQETEINGAGPEIPQEALDGLKEKISGMKAGDTLVLAGSVPASVPKDIYGQLLEVVPEKVRAVVDTTGESLLQTLSYHPFLIKPNHEELGQLFGCDIQTVEEAKEYGKLLQGKGARNVIVSMGEKGALLLEEQGRAIFCHAVKGEMVSTVGAGDSLIAGVLFGYQLHGTLEGGLRWGVCAGAATAFTKGIATGEQVKQLFPQVGNCYPI